MVTSGEVKREVDVLGRVFWLVSVNRGGNADWPVDGKYSLQMPEPTVSIHKVHFCNHRRCTFSENNVAIVIYILDARIYLVLIRVVYWGSFKNPNFFQHLSLSNSNY